MVQRLSHGKDKVVVELEYRDKTYEEIERYEDAIYMSNLRRLWEAQH